MGEETEEEVSLNILFGDSNSSPEELPSTKGLFTDSLPTVNSIL